MATNNTGSTQEPQKEKDAGSALEGSPTRKDQSSAKAYLQEHSVADVLEAFVTDLVQERPADVLRYMQVWSTNAIALLEGSVARPVTTSAASSQASGQSGSPAGGASAASPAQSPAGKAKKVDEDEIKAQENHMKLQSMAVRASWAQLKPAAKDLAKTFFTVVTTQHRSLTRTLLKDADFEFLGEKLGELLDAVIMGTASDAELAAVSVQYGAGRNLDDRHYDYFITGMLSALSIHLKEDFAAVSDAWRILLTEITRTVKSAVELVHQKDDGDRDDSAAADPEKATDLIGQSWNSIENKTEAFSKQFFTLLTLQHPSLKCTVLKGVDLDAAAVKLTETVDGVVTGRLSEDTLEALALQYGFEFGIDPPKHSPYFITTALAALKIALGAEQFNSVAEPWRLVLTRMTEAVDKGMKALDQHWASVDFAETKTNEPQAEEAMQVATPPDVIADSWNSIVDRKNFSSTFFSVITTQHPVLLRTVLKGVDLDELGSNYFIPLLDDYVMGKLTDEGIKEKALTFGAQRPIQHRFYDYFLTALLTTLSLTLDKSDFAQLSDVWRRKLTHLIEVVQEALKVNEEAAAAGSAPASTPPAEGAPAASEATPTSSA